MKAPKFYHLNLNLQQGIIHTNSKASNAVCAFYSKHSKVLIIRAEYNQFNKEIVEFAGDNANVIFDKVILFAAGFSIDTWDRLLDSYCKD